MTLASQIAERIHAFEAGQLSPTARDWVRAAFIDTIGCTLAGMAEEAPHLLMRAIGAGASPGPASIWSTPTRTHVLDAILVNGTASHALDYDDVAGVLGGHPSAMLVPPLIALAESQGSSGQDVTVAYVVGYETMCRIARGVHFHHYDKGWHPTATLGIFGTVAAAARLLHLDIPATATALGLAASLASGLKANFGTMTKPLHVGHAARNGVFAALMVQAGYTANPGTFEHKQGFLDVFNGPGTYDTARMLGEWFAPPDCEGPGDPGLKPYPCCGSTHASVAVTIGLARSHDLRAADVEHIEVMPHPRRLPHTDNPNPTTPLAAKFSVQYCVARALNDRAVTLGHFEGDAQNAPAIRDLMARVTARPHPDMAPDSPLQWGTEVVITTKSGRRIGRRLDDYLSRGPAGNPMTREELWTKFEDCARRSLPVSSLSVSAIAPLFEALGCIDTLPRITDLTPLLAPPSA